MKNKKPIAIILCIGLLVSSLSNSLVSIAKDNKREGFKKYDMDMDNSMTETLPTATIVEMDSEINNYDYMPNNKIAAFEEEILYEGTQSTLDPEQNDMFHIGEEEIKEMMQKGYSVADIFEADKIANEIFIEPQILLEKTISSNKSLEQIKKDILEESREKAAAILKEKHKDEYERLKNKNMKENEIMLLLAYADVNNMIISDKLIEEYQKIGDKLFEKSKDELNRNALSQETKNKYQISDTSVEDISEELIDKLEILSQKTGKPVKELLKSYINTDKR